MSSYFFRHCLGFNLITMFGFGGCAGLSVCCGNEFICNQWKRKGMHRYIYSYV